MAESFPVTELRSRLLVLGLRLGIVFQTSVGTIHPVAFTLRIRIQHKVERWIVENELARLCGGPFSKRAVTLSWGGCFEFDAPGTLGYGDERAVPD